MKLEAILHHDARGTDPAGNPVTVQPGRYRVVVDDATALTWIDTGDASVGVNCFDPSIEFEEVT